tara:strand:- start:661 stop:1269 length:609 start_codon:yes stop_codon:yes gene_type:complete
MTTAKKKTTTTRKPRVVKAKVAAPIPNLPKKPFVFEVLDLVSKQKSKAKKVEVLKKYDEFHLRSLFLWNFDTTIESALPDGEVPYQSYDDQNTYSGTLTTKMQEDIRSMHETGSFSMGVSDTQGRTTIRREIKNFYHFVKGGNDGMNNMRRESMFINILQGLHPLEAEIVCLVKDGKLSDKYNITREIVEEAYPDILWRDKA